MGGGDGGGTLAVGAGDGSDAGVGDLAEAGQVGGGHEAVAEHANADGFRHRWTPQTRRRPPPAYDGRRVRVRRRSASAPETSTRSLVRVPLNPAAASFVSTAWWSMSPSPGVTKTGAPRVPMWSFMMSWRQRPATGRDVLDGVKSLVVVDVAGVVADADGWRLEAVVQFAQGGAVLADAGVGLGQEQDAGVLGGADAGFEGGVKAVNLGLPVRAALGVVGESIGAVLVGTPADEGRNGGFGGEFDGLEEVFGFAGVGGDAAVGFVVDLETGVEGGLDGGSSRRGVGAFRPDRTFVVPVVEADVGEAGAVDAGVGAAAGKAVAGVGDGEGGEAERTWVERSSRTGMGSIVPWWGGLSTRMGKFPTFGRRGLWGTRARRPGPPLEGVPGRRARAWADFLGRAAGGRRLGDGSAERREGREHEARTGGSGQGEIGGLARNKSFF